MVRIGLVGCGFIGSRLADAIQHRFRGQARLIGLWDTDPAAARRLSVRCRPPVPVADVAALLKKADLVIEAASPRAAAALLPKAISKKKSLLVMSSGGLLGRERLIRQARKRGICLIVPSGALIGLDGVKAAAVGGLRSVTLTTRKPPRSFRGAPGLSARHRAALFRIQKPVLIFRGSARRAAAGFPQNINVAAALALAGLGADRTFVRIIADPSVRSNIHEVTAAGAFGRFFVRTENRAAQENPRTSRLAVDSALSALDQFLGNIRIGT